MDEQQQEEIKRTKHTPLFLSDLDDDQLRAIFGDSLRFVLCQPVLVKASIFHQNPQNFFGTISAGVFSLDPLLQHNRSIFNREFNKPIHISPCDVQFLHPDICYCSLPVSSTSVVQIAAKLYVTTDKLDDVVEYPPDDIPEPQKLEPVTSEEEMDEVDEFFRELGLSPPPRPGSTQKQKQIAEPNFPIPNLEKEPHILFNKALHVSVGHTSINISDKPNGGAGCSKLRGADGALYLRYVVFKYAIDAELEVEFLTQKHTQVTGSVRAYHGKGFHYDDNDNPDIDYHVWLLHPPDHIVVSTDTPAAYVKPGRVSLCRSVLPVPANYSLIIEAKLDQGKDVILSGTLEFPVPRDYHSSSETIQGHGCSLRLKVNWKLPPSEEPKIRSSSNSSSVTCHLTDRRSKFGANSTSTMADPDECNRWSLQEEIAKVFNTSLERTFRLQEGDVVPYSISTCTKEDDGDYMCSSVLDIWPNKENARLYNGPKLAGLAVKDDIMSSDYKDMMERCVVCGPGLVKFKLCREWVAKSIRMMLRVGLQTWAPKLSLKKAIIYLFVRNLAAEEVHMDHVRSTFIGETLARMLEYSGVVVLRRGIYDHSFPYNIQSWHDVHTYYEAVELKEERHHMDSVNETIRGGYKMLYHKLLGIDVKKEDESFYESYTKEILELEKGLPIGIEKDELQLAHLLALGHALKEEKADWIVHVSDARKRVYVEMCITAAQRAGLIANDHFECPLSHVGFGLVQGDDFERFRTSNSKVVNLVNLGGEVQSRCKVLLERQGDMAKQWIANEFGFEHAAKALGSSAFRYANLKNNRLTNYIFSFDEMLNEEGNNVVYLQFTHVRICSIITNSSKDVTELTDEMLILKHDDERELGLHLLRFAEVLGEVCKILAPHILCDYLYGLCKKFNSLDSSVWQVVGSSEEASKLLLCKASEVVMRKCFDFLGITPIVTFTCDY